MSTPNKSVRLSADEFIEKIEKAPSYALVMNPVYDEIELIVRDEAVKGYLGPDPETADADDLVAFLERLETIVKQDSDARKALLC